MVTLLSEVESVLNSRPLTYLDAVGSEFVTPAHFLNLNRSVGSCIPPLDPAVFDEFRPGQSSVSMLNLKLKKLEMTISHFWSIWYNEYLLCLRERSVHHRHPRVSVSSKPCVGDLMIVGEKDVSRSLWKLGRVVEVNLSDDGNVRSVCLKMPSGNILKCPVNTLYPLELRACTNLTAEQNNGGRSSTAGAHDEPRQRPSRSAAETARSRLAAMFADSDTDCE